MSRLILTMGRTARTPYLIEKIERKVYTIEELCYSLAQCAQLLDDSIRDPDLVIWLGSECGLTDLSVKLRPWLDRRNAYVEFVMVILEYAAYQSPARQKEIRREMEESEGMEPYRQLLARAEYSAGQGRIGQAQSELDGVLAALPELEREMRSRVWQQKGRLYAGQFSFRKASDCYYRAWKLTHDRHSGKCYLAALRMVTSQEEWDDPMEKATDLPTPPRPELPAAINPVIDAHQKGDFERTVYSVAIDEKEFMRFNIQNDGSPATMIALLFSRAMARLYPDRKDVIRVALALNQRGGLGTPKAHQSLVGGVFLEYKDAIKDWTIERQATAYRGMVFVQTMKKTVLAGVASMKGVNQMLMSKTSDQERLAIVDAMGEVTDRLITATVSYVGKAGFKESEDYIRDRFTIDFLQSFSSPLYVNAFLEELEDNGVKYDLQDVMKTELPNIRYPWAE